MTNQMHRQEGENDELTGVESYLQFLLQPVIPRQSFVSNLKERLQTTPIPASRWLTLLGYTAIVTAVLISTAILLATGVRAALAFLGALGLIHQIKGQKPQQKLV